MTSGNRSDEPIAIEDADAVARLGGIADYFLAHNRPIHIRCDDSVTRAAADGELPLRRSRGSAPQPIALPVACPRPILAVGGQLKSTFALGRGDQAFLSHHLGDLDHYAAFEAFQQAVEHYERLFGIRPELIVHDLHPDYASTGYALRRLETDCGLRGLGVQHHHAHVASCMAENGLDEPVIGVAFDGSGFGTDGSIWGGEFLVGDYQYVRRAAHFRAVPMPGGEQAVREPWRMAAAHLIDAGEDLGLLRDRLPQTALRIVERMIERRVNAPLTSSAGRLFDAVASLAGLGTHVTYEGQAAIELEWLSMAVPPSGRYPFEVEAPRECGHVPSLLVIDTRPLIASACRDARRGVCAAGIGRRFHSSLAEIIVQVCRGLREQAGLDAVVLSGGVFMNALLLTETLQRLTADHFRAYRHRRVPPNDGGLALGQLAIAACLESGDRR